MAKKTKKVTDNARVVNDQVTHHYVVDGIHENRRQLDERAFYPALNKITHSIKKI